jgi:hypothetical protein
MAIAPNDLSAAKQMVRGGFLNPSKEAYVAVESRLPA